ncbi:MAG: dUTP diphosphatase [Alphaproteobacteria bacterium]|jgi:dUTP pyrophosphatase|nr:dUTP diphosphatase [Alphaproteobacteria bacterium]MBT5859690.1 dUTP diphosphatase [Alphaproteobacteria bacterium]
MKESIFVTQVPLERLPGTDDLALPAYATAGAAGLDLVAAVENPMVLEPSARVLIPTGIRIALPVGTEGQIRPRSGLAWKFGITVLNAPGTIDADYRGEVRVLLVNLGTEAFAVERGMRVAQLVIARTEHIKWVETAEIPGSQRGDGAFGSTGGITKFTAAKGGS